MSWGGKALGLQWLKEQGFNVPDFVVLDSDLLRNASDGSFPSSSVLNLVETFVAGHKGNTFCVRSSADVEDGTENAFAGQFSSFMDLHSVADIIQAIANTVASTFDDGAKVYAKTHGISIRDNSMSVILMVFIKSTAAGVGICCLKTNPRITIEGSHGHGERVVGGSVIPDSWEVDEKCIVSKRKGADSSKNRSQMYCLSDEKVLELSNNICKIARLKNLDVDVEWALDSLLNIHFVQLRPLTRRFRNTVSWQAPNNGGWGWDGSHFPVPVSKLFESEALINFSAPMIQEHESVGSSYSHAEFISVNKVVFYQPKFCSPLKSVIQLYRSGIYAERHGWIEKFNEWKKIVSRRKLQDRVLKEKIENSEKMEPTDFVNLVHEVIDNYKGAFFDHHSQDFHLLTGMGWIYWECSMLLQVDINRVLELMSSLESSSTRLLWNHEFCEKLQKEIEKDKKSQEALFSPKSIDDAAQLADFIESSSNSVKALYTQWIESFGHFSLGSIGTVSETVMESPSIILEGFRQAVRAAVKNSREEAIFDKLVLFLKDKKDKEKLRKLTELAEKISGWRDERPLVCEVPATGLLRLILIRVWKRIPSDIFSSSMDLSECTRKEIISLIGGDLQERFKIRERIEGRISLKNHVLNAGAPRFLGKPPSLPPDPETLLRAIGLLKKSGVLLALVVAAVILFSIPTSWNIRLFTLLILAFFHKFIGVTILDGISAELCRTLYLFRQVGVPGKKEKGLGKDVLVSGLGVSPGTFTGVARLVQSIEDINTIKDKDIVVVSATTAAFNAILPRIGGLVSDFGGALSHMAISAREYGIPCVVGTENATKIIRNGSFITVDGTLGIVHK